MKIGQEGIKKDVVVFVFYCISLGDEGRKEGKEGRKGIREGRKGKERRKRRGQKRRGGVRFLRHFSW